MNHSSKARFEPPPEQQAIRAKCFHPTGTFAEFPKEEVEQSIPARFEKIVKLYPDHESVSTRVGSLTYKELDQAANYIGCVIASERGAKVEPVMVLCQDAFSILAACLGILKAGKIIVLVDPSFPLEHVRYMMQNSQAGAIVTDTANFTVAKDIAQDGRQVIEIDAVGSQLPEVNPSLRLQVSADSPALIVYSSGSTGQPKGIFYNHRRILHDVMVEMNAVHICPEDRIVQLRKLSFGAGIKGLFRALLSGATLFPHNVYRDGLAELPGFLNEAGITIFPPGVPIFRHFIAQLNGTETFPSIRLVTMACETVSQQDIGAYKKTFSENCVLLHHYSSSEAGLVCQYFIDKKTELEGGIIPIGYPVEGKTIFLRDQDGKTVGCDQVGEIAIRSRYISSGYWRDSELTNAKFLPDSTGGDERICLTGDHGRMRPDGSLLFLGRKDSVVKIRGYSVEIGNVERALLRNPTIREAKVVAWDSEPGEKYLTAYVVSTRSGTLPIDDLRRIIRETLPEYMIPTNFIFLDAIPFADGKLDRRALPRPDGKRPPLKQSYVLPRTEIEKTLVEVWEDVLNIRPIGIHDNFFNLGGHSLSATRLVSQLIKNFQLEIPLRSLFESPTAAQMAAVIAEHQAKKIAEPELGRILAELESISEEKARQLLADATGTNTTREPDE
jgi:acyl-coenzyme A synthetase/AMP-(fatty) acid ligase/acyl carrier protein